MDVVQSTSNPSELFVYLVNHRIPLGDANPVEVGADSVIEIFTTTVGGTTLNHKRTIEDPIIVTPNSVSGSGDGESFYFTNDRGVRVGLVSDNFPLPTLEVPNTDSRSDTWSCWVTETLQ
jgi:hypothetical protein